MKEYYETKKSLEQAMDAFKEKHGIRAEIRPRNMDLTEAFMEEERYLGPRTLGDVGGKHKVKGYVVARMHAVQKYETDEDGELIYRDGRFASKEIDDEIIVNACLCLPHVRNTTLAEVYLPTRRKRNVQGYRTEVVNRIIHEVWGDYRHFDPMEDTLYMFAGPERLVNNRIRLHQMMLEGILERGSKDLEVPSLVANAYEGIKGNVRGLKEFRLFWKVADKELRCKTPDPKYKRPHKPQETLEELEPFTYNTKTFGMIEESAVYLHEKMKTYEWMLTHHQIAITCFVTNFAISGIGHLINYIW